MTLNLPQLTLRPCPDVEAGLTFVIFQGNFGGNALRFSGLMKRVAGVGKGLI